MAEPHTLTGRKMAEYLALALMGVTEGQRQAQRFAARMPRTEAEWLVFYQALLAHLATLDEAERNIRQALDIVAANGLITATGEAADILRDLVQRVQAELDALE